MNPILPQGLDVLFTLIVLGSLAILIGALVDLWKSKADQNTKLLWTLVVVILNPIGGIIWFAAGRKANR
jgi:hypothetical protein